MNLVENGTKTMSFYLSASRDEAYNYRSLLYGADIDMYELAEKHSINTVAVGGVDCVRADSTSFSEKETDYIGRSEKAGVTVQIIFSGKLDEAKMTALLNCLKFTQTDTGNVDPPWPWKGTPFKTAASASEMAGTFTIKADWLPLDKSLPVQQIFDSGLAVDGNTVYLFEDGVLKQYANTGSGLTYQADLVTDKNYSTISMGADHTVYLSGLMEKLSGYKNGKKSISLAETDYVVMAPDGTWGLSWFVGSDTEKIMIANESLTRQTMTFDGIDTVHSVSISSSHIMLSGTPKGSYDEAVYVYDLNGALQFVLGGTPFGADDSLGSITSVVETASGFLALDGNMRKVCLWKPDGTFIGTIDAEDLFGTDYPWMSKAQLLPDGSIMVAMTQERDDESADEVLVYRLTGF